MQILIICLNEGKLPWLLCVAFEPVLLFTFQSSSRLLCYAIKALVLSLYIEKCTHS